MKVCKAKSCQVEVPGRADFCPECKAARVKIQQAAAHDKWRAKGQESEAVREHRNQLQREKRAEKRKLERVEVIRLERVAAPAIVSEPVTNTIIHIRHLASMGLTVREGLAPASDAKVLAGAEFEAAARAILAGRQNVEPSRGEL